MVERRGSCKRSIIRSRCGPWNTATSNSKSIGSSNDTCGALSQMNSNLVVIPTYNEAENLEDLVKMVLAQGPFDALIVDDHSPDGTGGIADALADRYPGRVAVMHRAGKQGLGTAYRAGFGYALMRGYEHVFEMDADFSHDPRTLPDLRAALA